MSGGSTVISFYDDYYESVEAFEDFVRRWDARTKSADCSTIRKLLNEYTELVKRFRKSPPDVLNRYMERWISAIRKQPKDSEHQSRSLAGLFASCEPARLQRAVDRLEDGKAKQVVLLRNEGIGFAEISKSLNISLPRAFALYRDATKQLLELLEEEDS